jgi:hypothetical protein
LKWPFSGSDSFKLRGESIEAVGDEGRVDGFDGAAVRRSGPTTEEHTGGDGEHLFEFDQFEG